ncbi:MAG: putative porin [Bacteroidia bacterium]
MRKTLAICVLLSLILGSRLEAQVDSAAIIEKGMVLRYYKLQEFGFDTSYYHKPDTALHGVWQYDPAWNREQYAYLGVLASAARPLLLSSGTFTPFDLGYHQYDAYRFDARNRNWWDVNKPLTSFNFASGGGNNQQAFELFHTQNIGKTVNIGAEYRLLTSDGFYQNEKTNNRNLRFFGSMVSPRRKYSAHLNYTTNSNTNEQNGGIVPGRLFEEGQFILPLTVPVNLNTANSRFLDRNWFLEQQFRLRGSDSSFTGVAAFHRLHYQRQFYNYRDNNPANAYYPDTLLSGEATFDSSGQRMLENAIGLRSLNVFGPWQWEAALHHQGGTVYTTRQPMRQHTVWTEAWLQYNLNRNLSIRADYHQVLANRLQDNTYHAKTKLAFKKRDKQGVSLSMMQQSQNPIWLSQRFSGNHQLQNNSFVPMVEQAVMLDVDLPLINFFVHQRRIQNWVYFDSLGHAAQHNAPVNLLQLGYKASWKWWKIRIDLNHGFQLGADGPMRAPLFYSQDVLSFNHHFSTGWELQLGADVRFHAAYFAPGFRPEIGQFVVQDSLRAGGVPMVDLFAAIKVKRTRIFVRMEHLNQGFPSPNFYAVPLYPMYDIAFRFGITWAFYN